MLARILTGKKLLIIEDQDFVSALYKKFFERNGAQVTVAVDGKSALDALERDTFDLVTLDHMLSEDMDGFEVLRRMRGDEKTKDIPVVILSNLNLKDEDLGFVTEHKIAGYYVKAEVSLETLSEVFQAIVLKE